MSSALDLVSARLGVRTVHDENIHCVIKDVENTPTPNDEDESNTPGKDCMCFWYAIFNVYTDHPNKPNNINEIVKIVKHVWAQVKDKPATKQLAFYEQIDEALHKELVNWVEDTLITFVVYVLDASIVVFESQGSPGNRVQVFNPEIDGILALVQSVLFNSEGQGFWIPTSEDHKQPIVLHSRTNVHYSTLYVWWSDRNFSDSCSSTGTDGTNHSVIDLTDDITDPKILQAKYPDAVEFCKPLLLKYDQFVDGYLGSFTQTSEQYISCPSYGVADSSLVRINNDLYTAWAIDETIEDKTTTIMKYKLISAEPTISYQLTVTTSVVTNKNTASYVYSFVLRPI